MKRKTPDESTIENIINILLKNRGIKTAKEKKDFLKPDLKKITSSLVGINKKELQKTIKRINLATS